MKLEVAKRLARLLTDVQTSHGPKRAQALANSIEKVRQTPGGIKKLPGIIDRVIKQLNIKPPTKVGEDTPANQRNEQATPPEQSPGRQPRIDSQAGTVNVRRPEVPKDGPRNIRGVLLPQAEPVEVKAPAAKGQSVAQGQQPLPRPKPPGVPTVQLPEVPKPEPKTGPMEPGQPPPLPAPRSSQLKTNWRPIAPKLNKPQQIAANMADLAEYGRSLKPTGLVSRDQVTGLAPPQMPQVEEQSSRRTELLPEPASVPSVEMPIRGDNPATTRRQQPLPQAASLPAKPIDSRRQPGDNPATTRRQLPQTPTPATGQRPEVSGMGSGQEARLPRPPLPVTNPKATFVKAQALPGLGATLQGQPPPNVPGLASGGQGELVGLLTQILTVMRSQPKTTGLAPGARSGGPDRLPAIGGKR